MTLLIIFTPMKFSEKKNSSNTNARISQIEFKNSKIELPIFMPVATQGFLRCSHFYQKNNFDSKGNLTTENTIILGNTFHLRNLNCNLNDYMGVKTTLTDSGGFQIISLKNFVNEDGVIFTEFDNEGNSLRDKENIECDNFEFKNDVENEIKEIMNNLKKTFISDHSGNNLKKTLMSDDSENNLKKTLTSNDSGNNLKKTLISNDHENNLKNTLMSDDSENNLKKTSMSDDSENNLKKNLMSDDSENKSKRSKISLRFCPNAYCFDSGCPGCEFEELQRQTYLSFYKSRNFDYKRYLLTPEKSIEIQNILSSNIAMQLDDVIRPDSEFDRHLIAVKRSIRWLDRQLEMHKNNDQVIFPIIQGGLNDNLRELSFKLILERAQINKNIKGIAIGGLCGGEDKISFCEIIYKTVLLIRKSFLGPIYVMGVGYPEDILISICLGSDMSDCVYPTRTARFGRMFSDHGNINILSAKKVEKINCNCRTCTNFSLDFLKSQKKQMNLCILLTEHNLFYIKDLINRIKENIQKNTLKKFANEYLGMRFSEKKPEWIIYFLKLLDEIESKK